MRADAIRHELAAAGIEAVIPAKSNRRNPAPHDREKYRGRNLAERLFNKLKNWRRIATRYDKTQESYLGFANLVSALQLIPFVHETWLNFSSQDYAGERDTPQSRSRVQARAAANSSRQLLDYA